MKFLTRTTLSILFSFFLFTAVFSSETFSQKPSCGIEVTAFDSMSSVSVSNFSVRFMSISDDTYEWKKVTGDKTIIKNLSPGIYNLSLRNKDFRISSYDFKLDCSKASKGGNVGIPVPLWKNHSFDSSVYVRFDKDAQKIVRYFPKRLSSWVGSSFRSSGFGESQSFATLDGGVLNQKAIKLVEPKFAENLFKNETAKTVEVEVLIGLDGSVEAAEGLASNMLINEAAVRAAKVSKFGITKHDNKPAKVLGRIVYRASQ